MRNKFVVAILALVLLGVGAGLGPVLELRKAHAQSLQLSYSVASGTVSIAAGTPAVLVTNTTTGNSAQKIVVVGVKLATITTGGIVTFYNGADATKTAFAGGNGLSVYAPVSTTVNNNVTLDSTVLPQQGSGVVATTAGSSFCAQLNGSTIVYQVQYYMQ